MRNFSQQVNSPLFESLCSYLEETYQCKPVVEFSKCSMQYGWNIKYKKGGRSLCTLYPQDGSFLALVVIGQREAGEAELLLPEESPITRAVRAGHSGSAQLPSEKGEQVLAGYAPVQGAGWGVVAQRPLEATLAELKRLAWDVAGVVVPMLLLIMLVIWWLSRIIAEPLRQLALSVQQNDGQVAAREVRKVQSWYYEAAQLKRSILTGLELLNRKIGKLNLDSITDPLTGLANRRGAQLALEEWENDARPFAVVLMDIDHFKQVNDQFGHDVGDRTLQYLARQMRKVERASDVLCRSGGEEFMMLLPDTGLEDATRVAERLHQLMQASVEAVGRPVTLSFGVAHYPTTSSFPEQVLKAADEALYRAKNGGRNRVEVAPAQQPGG